MGHSSPGFGFLAPGDLLSLAMALVFGQDFCKHWGLKDDVDYVVNCRASLQWMEENLHA